MLDRVLNHPAAILVAAVGRQLEQFLGDFVEVVRERDNLANPATGGGQGAFAVFVKGHLEFGSFAVLFGIDELIDDLPKLALGLFDQAIHGTARVEEDGELDDGRGFGFCGCGRRSGMD